MPSPSRLWRVAGIGRADYLATMKQPGVQLPAQHYWLVDNTRSVRTLFVTLALFWGCIHAVAAEFPAEFVWSRQAGKNGVAADELGNVYTSGVGSVLSSGFLSKFTRSGELIWSKNLVPGVSLIAVTTDGTNGIYVTGGFGGEVNFGGTTLTNVGDSDVFVAKYDSSGSLVWVRQVSGDYEESSGIGICADSQGQVYVTGVLSGAGNFGTTNFLPNSDFGQHTGFLAKYDAAGALLWAASVGSGDVTGVAIDARGNSYVCGWFPPAFGIGNGSMFLAKHDADGQLMWQRHASAGWAEYCGPQAVAVANTNLIVLTGSYYGTINFGTTNLSGGGLFVAGYDHDGSLLWLRNGGVLGRAIDIGYKIATDQMANSYVFGWFYDTVTFGRTNLTAVGIPDMFVAKFNSAGDVAWVLQATNCAAGGAAADTAGNIYFTGEAFSPTSLDGRTRIPQGTFLGKLATTSIQLRFSSGKHEISASWSTLADGFVLEEAEDLSQSPTWTTSQGTVQQSGTEKRMIFPFSGQQKYLRLRKR